MCGTWAAGLLFAAGLAPAPVKDDAEKVYLEAVKGVEDLHGLVKALDGGEAAGKAAPKVKESVKAILSVKTRLDRQNKNQVADAAARHAAKLREAYAALAKERRRLDKMTGSEGVVDELFRLAREFPAPAAAREQVTGESLLLEMLDLFQDLGTAMEKVKDEKTAERGLARVKEARLSLGNLKARDKKVGNEEKDRLMKRFEKPLHDAGFKVGMELARIQSQPYGAEITKEVNALLAELQKQ